MRTTSGCAVLALAAGGALSLAACSSSDDRVQHCQTASECPSGSRCVSQACVANAPPVASFAVPGGTIEANAVVTFDASGSYDPDAPGDSIVSYAWSVAPVDAPCAAPAVASTARDASVRFACAGTYEVTLVAKDEMSAASAPSTRQVAVAAYTGTPLVVSGADVTASHACTGVPLVCTTVGGPVQLSATPTDAAPAELSYRWTVEAPQDRPLAADRRVTFSPSADVAAPAAAIETDGTAISGDWIFRVEARDALGVVATLATRVSVGNSDPVVTATVPASFPHAFSRTLSQFTSAGTIPFTVTDPDGDPLVGRTIEWRHSGDGGALFEGQDLSGPDRATFNVLVNYTQPSDALLLRGGAGLARSIELSIADVNGAVTKASWPIAIGNQEPRATSPAAVDVNHSFDLGAMEYRADAVVGTWADDDGDPFVQLGATGDDHCATAEVVAGQGVVHCALPYGASPAANLFTGSHPVTVLLGDPWGAPPASPIVIRIANRAPVVGPASGTATGTCTQGGCCRHDVDVPSACVAYTQSWGGGTGSATPNVSDPDGDPVTVQASGFPTYVAFSAADLVPVSAWVASAQACVDVGTPTTVSSTAVDVTASDGAASTAGVVTISARCP